MFRCSTGEDWYSVMFDCANKDNGGNSYALIYFISFILICSFIMLNLFILVIIEQFGKYMGNEDNPIEIFKDYL